MCKLLSNLFILFSEISADFPWYEYYKWDALANDQDDAFFISVMK